MCQSVISVWNWQNLLLQNSDVGVRLMEPGEVVPRFPSCFSVVHALVHRTDIFWGSWASSAFG